MPARKRQSTWSVVKAVAYLREDFPRIQVMRASKRQAVVQQHAAIGNVGRAQRERESLSKFFPEAHVEGRVAGKMVRRRVAIRKARRVVNIGGRVAAPRQIHRPAEVQGIALVVIEQKEVARRREIRQAAVDGAYSFRHLV